MMNRRLMDFMRNRDSRNPYGSRGGYVVPSRRMRDRGMIRDYGRSMRDMNHNYENDYRASNKEYPYDMRGVKGQYDRNYTNDNGYFDPMMYDMPYYDYNYQDYGYYGDYGKNLSHEELEQWKSMLMRQVDDKDRQTFDINAVTQKAKQMGIQMHNFNEEELVVAMLIVYTDYGKILKQYVGNNMDIYIHLGAAFLNDEDSAVKGSEKLSVYYDCIVNA